jgi:hypothetical protein
VGDVRRRKRSGWAEELNRFCGGASDLARSPFVFALVASLARISIVEKTALKAAHVLDLFVPRRFGG